MPGTPSRLERSDFVDTTPSHVWMRRGAAPSMPRAHRHDDLEVNLVLDGHLDYLFGGSRVSVGSGRIGLFWAATPHRLIDRKNEETSDVCWVHIPLTTVLSWGLPHRNLNEILSNRLIVVPADAVERDVESKFESWRRDFQSGEGETIAVLEVHALVRRALRHHLQFAFDPESSTSTSTATSDGMRRVTLMAQFMVAHFREAISISDIACSAQLSPNYAMTLFRKAIGTTLGNYLTRCRVAEAQRLLITTSMTTLMIAHASGFGSQSNFYEHFTRMCGSSPGGYRRQFR